MQAISIGERLWLEPTLLGVTVNYSEGPDGLHFRVGLGYQSLAECDRLIGEHQYLWTLNDGSLSIRGDAKKLTLIFSAISGSAALRGHTLSGYDLWLFRTAIHYLNTAHWPSLN